MANRFPLIVDSAALQIKELPANDNLDLLNSGIVNAGVITATAFKGSGQIGVGIGTVGFGTVYLGLTTQFDFVGAGVTITTDYDPNSGITTLTFSGGSGGGGVTADSYWVKTNSGIHTLSNVGIGTTIPNYLLEIGSVGTAGTSLFVHGDARITGILTVGSSSITIDGVNNIVTIGAGVTIDGNTGSISGISSNINITNDTTTNVTRYIIFGAQTEGVDQPRVDSTNLTYNPSTNTLVSNTFQGFLSGTASNAVRSGITTNVTITDTNVNSTHYVHFGTQTSGSDGVDVDSGGLTYNPSSNTLSTGTVVATTFSGTATNATNVTGTSSNGFGTRTIQAGGVASGGSSGDIYYIY